MPNFGNNPLSAIMPEYIVDALSPDVMTIPRGKPPAADDVDTTNCNPQKTRKN